MGKTSLIRFLNALPFDANLPPNHQIEQTMITLKRGNQTQRLRVWDICSECTIFHSVSQWIVISMPCAALYYTHAEIILLCYAINDAVFPITIINTSQPMSMQWAYGKRSSETRWTIRTLSSSLLVWRRIWMMSVKFLSPFLNVIGLKSRKRGNSRNVTEWSFTKYRFSRV